MRWEFPPVEAPDIAQAEAQQQIAYQLERIADALEEEDDGLP